MTTWRPPATNRRDTAEPEGQASEVLRLFEAKALTWPAKYGQDGPLTGRLASMSAAVRWHAQAGARVLDLGCGTGELARALATAGFRVVGCDISRHMLQQAARDRGQCAGWVRLAPDWRCLPFAPAAFDVVVAASVLEYVADPAAVLRECARVLRPGGVILYTVPDLRHPVRWAEWLARQLIRVIGAPSRNGRRSRWTGYHAYLRASRQRHRVRWWRAASAVAGQRPVPGPADDDRSALRLLAFCSAGQSVSRPLGPSDGETDVRQ